MKRLTTDLADYEFDNQILVVIPKAGIVLEKNDMETMLKEAIAFTNSNKYYALIDTSNHVETTVEARNYYATSEYTKFRRADAFIVKSLPVKMLYDENGNLYTKKYITNIIDEMTNEMIRDIKKNEYKN